MTSKNDNKADDLTNSHQLERGDGDAKKLNDSQLTNESSINECGFIAVPIDGMEFVQQNFVKYNDPNTIAREFSGRVTLSKRFALLERGFILRLRDNAPKKSMFDKVYLKCERPVYAAAKKKDSNMRTFRKPFSASTGNKGTPTDADLTPPLNEMQNLNV